MNCEFVDARDLLAGAHRTGALPAGWKLRPELALIAAVRKWFWSRRTGSGFVLAGFPESLLQASILDEWMDARDEALDACLVPADGPGDAFAAVARHYRLQGVPTAPLAMEACA